MTIGQSIQDGILLHVTQDIREATDASLQVMAEVGLTPPEDLFGKYPADLSGGQKQRAVLARALALRPSLIVADEPVAMLDMSIRARILELLLSLRRRHGLAILFITHDLATAKFVCDRIAIMYLGRIVETGPSEAIFQDPKHPYTRALIGAIPVPEPGHRRERTLPHGEVPDAIVPPAGCRFHPRCPVALASCGWEARDFLAYLEDRRLRSSDPEAAEEVLGSVEDWYADGRTARTSVPAENARAVARRVGGLLEEAPPAMAAAVSDVFVRGNEVLVRFREPDVLTPKTVDGREVECLLY
jgi:peptide/nickel transport system ATP-binding protein